MFCSLATVKKTYLPSQVKSKLYFLDKYFFQVLAIWIWILLKVISPTVQMPFLKSFCPVQVNTWLKKSTFYHRLHFQVQIFICHLIKIRILSSYWNATKIDQTCKVCTWVHCSNLWLLLITYIMYIKEKWSCLCNLSDNT